MRRWFGALALFLLLLGGSWWGAPAGSAQQNLLRNPGFEGNFAAWGGINEVQMAAEWTPWWFENGNNNPQLFRPEYKRADVNIFPNRVLSGGSAQQYFTFHASHYAGMYQQVFNVQPGQNYQFSIYAQVWSSSEDNPYQSVGPANPRLQVGIDPTGWWDPNSPNVVWSPEAGMNAIIDQWGLVTVDAVAQSSTITVFVRTNPDWSNKHNDMYWDNASLIAAAPGQPTAAPTNTPAPPTATSPATAIPPTATPAPPTATSPPPTATNVPPTATTEPPTATATAVPPTETSVPPTETSVPPTSTATAVPPTATIEPPTAEPPTAEPTAAATVAATAIAAVVEPTQPPAATPAPAAQSSSGSQPSINLVLAVAAALLAVLLAIALVLLWRGRQA